MFLPASVCLFVGLSVLKMLRNDFDEFFEKNQLDLVGEWRSGSMNFLKRILYLLSRFLSIHLLIFYSPKTVDRYI